MQPEKLLRGDYDGDGKISLEDAQNLLNAYTKMLAGAASPLTDAQKNACDINGDKSIDVADAQLVLLYYVRNTLAKQPTTWEQLLKLQK